MAEPHAYLNGLSEADARVALTRCCGAARWVDGMLRLRPFASDAVLFAAATSVWASCCEADYHEAFSHHPAIGENIALLRARFSETAAWSGAEQAGVADADERTLRDLHAANQQYRARFGFIFIVCATGKSAREMLALLYARLPNTAADELHHAAAEQAKITQLRLRKLS